MASLLYILILLGSSCMAFYRKDYDSRNLIARDEPSNEKLVLVDCPVCVENTEHWLFEQEECPFEIKNKHYKECKHGTYINDVCGNRRDCFRGPGEPCSEKMEYDIYGQKCAPGLYCNKVMGVCTGISYSIDSKQQLLVNPHRYPLRERRDTQAHKSQDIS